MTTSGVGDHQTSELRERFQRILENAVRALSGQAGFIALWDRKRRRFTYEGSVGLTPEAVKQYRPLLLAPSVRGNTPIPLEPAAQREHIPGEDGALASRYAIALPLRSADETVGAIYVFRSDPAFVLDERTLLSAFAEQVTFAVENLRLASDLVEEKRKVESIIERSADGIMSLDTQGRVTSFNAGMEQLTGWQRHEVIGRLCQDVLQARTAQGEPICRTRCPLTLAQHSDRATYEYEATITARDGQPIPVSIAYTIVRSNQGEPVEAVVTVRDLSVQKETEAVRSAFLSMISHELQTPVTVIKAYAELLHKRYDGTADDLTKEALVSIDEESDRLRDAISQLLYAARVEAGGVKVELAPLALGPLIQKVVRRMHVRTSIHQLESRIPTDPLTALGDEDKIEEVLVNLLDNAIKYSPKGGKITVEAQTTGDEVVISVQDQGAGIPLQRQQQLFQPFQRLTDGAPNIPGTGLGLFISGAIIRAHGGRIWVESQRGKGSRFTFTLPRQERAFLPAVPFSAPLSLGPPAPASGKAGKPRPKRTARRRR